MNPGSLESKDVLPHPNPSPSTERGMIPPSPQAERVLRGKVKDSFNLLSAFSCIL